MWRACFCCVVATLARALSRAFIFEDAEGDRAVFVSVDAGMIGQLIKQHVRERERGGRGEKSEIPTGLLSNFPA